MSGGHFDYNQIINRRSRKSIKKTFMTYKKKIGVLAGCFDIIHPGYIYMFEEAKYNCDKLIVLLQTDPTIDRPEKNKPILSLNERIKILESIKYIDEIVIYGTEKELYELLKKIKPDVRFLGDDYIGKEINGGDLNIKIIYINRKHGWSSTKFKQLIFEQLYNKNKNYMKEINWKNIKFIARPETWFDEGTIAELTNDIIDMKYTSGLFNGIKDGEEDGEVCSFFEFDWVDENDNILNSNIPNIESLIIHDNYIIENNDTGEQYDYLNNIKIVGHFSKKMEQNKFLDNSDGGEQDHKQYLKLNIGETIEDIIKKVVYETLNKSKDVEIPEDIIETDNIGEVIEKLTILNIRMWYLEDACGLATSDEELASLKRKIDICFKQKRPKYVSAINKMIDKAIIDGKSLVEDSVKLYKGHE